MMLLKRRLVVLAIRSALAKQLELRTGYHRTRVYPWMRCFSEGDRTADRTERWVAVERPLGPPITVITVVYMNVLKFTEVYPLLTDFGTGKRTGFGAQGDRHWYILSLVS